MRKIFASVFVLMLLFTAAIPAGASDIQSGLVDFISEIHDLDREDFKVAELYEVELENLGLSLSVLTWHTERIRGQVAQVTETGEYLADEELMALMNQERELWAAEYARLQQEAGKMDPWLYQYITDGLADEPFEIIITPIFQLTPELETQIRELYKQYGFDAPQDFQGQVSPGFRGVDQGSSSSGDDGAGTGSADPMPDKRLPLPVTDPAEPGVPGTILPTSPTTPGAEIGKHEPADLPVSSEDAPDWDGATPGRDIYQPYPVEFYTELNELYSQGYAKDNIAAHLDSLGIEYRVEYGTIIASVTVQQALDLRDHQDINWIGSYSDGGDYHILPLADLAAGHEAAPGEARLAATDDRDESSTKPWIWTGAAFGLLAAGIFFIVKK